MTKPNHELSPALIVLMSIATGLAVASNDYAQPLLDTIARNFSLSASSAGFIVTAAQLGYAAGLLFLVPLGDNVPERRRLIVSMTLLAACGHVDYRQQSVAGDDDPRYGINRFILSCGTNSGSTGSDAGFTG